MQEKAVGIPLPDLSGLPPWAQAVAYFFLAVTVGLGTGVVWFGIIRGKLAPASKSETAATVAAVIVDSTELRRLTLVAETVAAALEALNLSFIEANMLTKQASAAAAAAAKAIREHAKVSGETSQPLVDLVRSLEGLKEELIRAGARKGQ
jgi:hypothetical protein